MQTFLRDEAALVSFQFPKLLNTSLVYLAVQTDLLISVSNAVMR